MLTEFRTTREKLLRAALTLVAREGFPAATTAAIAESAGVAEGTLYRHFDSKDDLLIEAYRVLKSEMAAAVEDVFDEDEAVAHRLARFWRGIYDSYRTDPDAFLFSQRFAQSELSKREGGEASQRFVAPLSALFEEGVASGALAPAPLKLFTVMFLATVSAMLREALNGKDWSSDELDAAAEAAVRSWQRAP